MAKKSLDDIHALIASHNDFPKPGIVFRDIFPVLRDPSAFRSLIDLMIEKLKEKCSGKQIDAVVGLDARGFLFAPQIALQLGVPFVPARKKGKLPGKVVQYSYTLEYGKDTFELQADSVKPGQNIVIVDDLIATGGSVAAVVSLLEKIGCKVIQCIAIIELTFLKGREKIGAPLESLITYDQES